jgi:hypothetical protein
VNPLNLFFLPKIIDTETTWTLQDSGTEIWAFYIVSEFIINKHVTFVFLLNNLD